MRISRITVKRWRNLRDLTIDLAAGADFLCLVGENGTGKSRVLDLLHFAALHLGLTDGFTGKRQPPYSTEEPYRIEVTLALGEQWREYLSQAPQSLEGA
jgi:recombinational DNA repair ATPase RecF